MGVYKPFLQVGNFGYVSGHGTVKADDGTQRAANAADIVGYPSDTYATLSTTTGGLPPGSDVGLTLVRTK